ncbi:MAG TPA: DNA modification methylase [Nitrospiraceae bacterium]
MEVRLCDIVTLEDRQRKLFNEQAIIDLATSIKTIGLLHPPVVRRDNGRVILMAGERRLRALRSLYPADHLVPVTLFEEVDPLMAKEIELEENLRRVDLSWKEVALATAELHALRKTTDPTWTAKQTTEEIKERGGFAINPTRVRDRTLLAAHLHIPEVANANSEAQAIKNLTRLMENDFRAAMALKAGQVESIHTLVQCDACEGMGTYVAPDSVDVVITDPPYGIEATAFGVQTVVEIHKYTDDWDQVEGLLANSIAAMSVVCKPSAHVYMFVDFRHWEDVKAMFIQHDWIVWSRPLIWVKNTGYTPLPDYGPRRNYETIMYAYRGRKMVTGVYSDVLTYASPVERKHAAQKPVELYKDLLVRSVKPDDVILDPFCGSGVVFEAAKALKLKAIGFDKDANCYTISKEKL